MHNQARTNSPCVSFEQARQIVDRERREPWSLKYDGAYMVAPYGFESLRHWLCVDGAREHLIEGQDGYLDAAGDVALVDKLTGHLTEIVPVFHGDYLATFTPVGGVPAYVPAGG